MMDFSRSGISLTVEDTQLPLRNARRQGRIAKKSKVETVQGDGFVLTISRSKGPTIPDGVVYFHTEVKVDVPIIRETEAFKTLGEVEGTVPPPADEQEDPEWEEFLRRMNDG